MTLGQLSPRQLLALAWAPGLIYSGYAIARLNGIQGETDLVGISGVMRIVFLAFGGSVAYLLVILAVWEPFKSRLRTGMWHAFMAWSLAMIIDDSFMVHEQLGAWLEITDSIPMLLLGVWLLIILVIHRTRFVATFWGCFAGFSVLAAIAVLSDVITGREGTFMVGTFEFDYEMVCECAAVFLFVAGLVIQATTEIRAAVTVPPQGSASD